MGCSETLIKTAYGAYAVCVANTASGFLELSLMVPVLSSRVL